VILKVDLDPKLIWRLGELAEKNSVTVDQLVAGVLVNRLQLRRATPRRPERQARIVELHGEGFTDVEIAERLECVREYVVQIRRRHGLKPNRKKVPA
jgi:DNA-directed RNA polymerase specialized sigma24 family protein